MAHKSGLYGGEVRLIISIVDRVSDHSLRVGAGLGDSSTRTPEGRSADGVEVALVKDNVGLHEGVSGWF